MDRVKTINGNLISMLTKDEINKELIAHGEWPIHYYVPGRTFRPYVIIINRERFRFNEYKTVEKFCIKYSKKELKQKKSYEIRQLINDIFFEK
jgi:hypothetical protein